MWKFTASKNNPPSIFRILSEASADGACLVKVTDIGKNAGCWLLGDHVLAPRDHKGRLASWRQYPLSRWDELKYLVERNREFFRRPTPAFAPREIKVESVAVELRKWTPKPGDFFRVPDNPKQQISKRDRRRGVTKPSEAAQPFKCTSITEDGVNATAADGTQGFLPYSCTFEPTLAPEYKSKYHFDPNSLSTHERESRIVWPKLSKKTSKPTHLVMGDTHVHELADWKFAEQANDSEPNVQLETYAKTRPHLLSFNAAEAEARVFAQGMRPLLNKAFPPPTTPLTNNPLDRLVNAPTHSTPRGRHDATAELVATTAGSPIPPHVQEFSIRRSDGTIETWHRGSSK